MNNVINLETSAITSKYLIFITTKVFVGHFASWHNKLYRQEIHDLLHSPLYGPLYGQVHGPFDGSVLPNMVGED